MVVQGVLWYSDTFTNGINTLYSRRSMPPHLIVWPTILSLFGALAIPRMGPWLPQRRYALVVLLFAVVLFVFALLIAATTPSEWVSEMWGANVTSVVPLRYRIDDLGRAFLILSGLVGLGALVGSLDEAEPLASREYQASLIGVMGGLFALSFADTLIGWMGAILVVDTALLYGLGMVGRPRWLGTLFPQVLFSDLLILVALILQWQEGLGVASTSSWLSLALLGAVIFRMAPLPFSLFVLADEPLPQRVMVMMPLVTVGIGGLWLARLPQFMGEQALAAPEALAVFAAVGVALAGWVAWRLRQPSQRMMMLTASQAAWVLWAWAWGYQGEAVAAAWAGSLALGALAFHGGRLDARHYGQLPSAVAVLMLLGGPLSAAWPVLSRVSGSAWQRGEQGLLALGIIGLMTTVVAYGHWLIPEQVEPTHPSRWVGGGILVLLSIPLVAALWGIRPPLPHQAISASWAEQWSLPVLGWAGGLWLWQIRERLAPLRALLDSSARLLSFGWLWRGLNRLSQLLIGAVRSVMLLLEGENYGWLVLFLLLALILLLPR